MAKRMLIDGTHPEEIRVVVTSGNKLEEYDVETSTKKQLKGNIYLAKVTRVEPSLQAAFVEYGGNRHGFLAFNEIHPDYYQIPIADREALLAEQEELDRQAEAAQAHVDEMDGGVDEGAVAEDDGDRDIEPDDADRDEAEPDAVAAADEAGPESDIAPGADEEAADMDADSEHDAGMPAAAESFGAPEPAVTVLDVAENGETTVLEDADVEPAVSADDGTEEDGDEGDDEDEDGDGERAARARGANGAERRRRRPPRRYKIQEVIKRRQILLVQVVKEERGNKGAALTTYISLAGRYCVLMPNTARGGGISRKITSATSRRKLRKILAELEIPDGMGVIMRTAGMERNKSEIKRDLDYLVRAWDEVRELTLRSTAPTLVYEEASLIKRAIRDLYSKETEEVLIDGGDAYQTAKKFMRLLMPSHAKRVQPYRDENIPLFFRYQVEDQLDAMHSPVVQLRSGGYLVIHTTEALVAIDVNSGRSTRERNIEETALKTNLEAAEEVARQLRLRDLAGLIVIDFIDMEETRNMRAVERRMRESMKGDRARIQIGRISGFGLLELSRQRLRPSLIETSTEACPHCQGTGFLRSTESMAVRVLRAIEEEGIRNRSSEVSVTVATPVAIYVLNQKRAALVDIENRYGFVVNIIADESVMPPEMRLERVRAKSPEAVQRQAISIEEVVEGEQAREAEAAAEEREEREDGGKRRSRRRKSRKKPGAEEAAETVARAEPEEGDEGRDEATAEAVEAGPEDDGEGDEDRSAKRRRRGRRGGRRRSRRSDTAEGETVEAATDEPVGGPEPPETVPAAEEQPAVMSAMQPAEEPWFQPEPIAVEPAATPEPALEAATETAVPPAEPFEPASPVEETNGEAIAAGPADQDRAADDEFTAATPSAEPEDIAEPSETATGAAAEAAANRPKKKGWWQKLV